MVAPSVGSYPKDEGSAVLESDVRGLVVSNSTLFGELRVTGWFVAYDLFSQTELWRVESRVDAGAAGGAAGGTRIRTDGEEVYAPYLSGEINAYPTTSSSVPGPWGLSRSILVLCRGGKRSEYLRRVRTGCMRSATASIGASG